MMKGLLSVLMLAAIAAAAWYLPAHPRHHYSETGVVYTTAYLTLHVPTGVVGFPPGSRLTSRFDVHVPDEEIVTDGKYTLAIDPQALTHDVEYAGELAEADQSDQDQSMAQIAQAKSEHAARQHAVELTHAQDMDGVNAAMVAASRVGNYDTRLHDPTSWAGVGGGYASSGSSGYSPGVVFLGGNNVSNVTIYGVGPRFGGAPQVASSFIRMVPTLHTAPQRPVGVAPTTLNAASAVH